MAKQVLVVLDNPPKEHDGWASEVFRQARLAPSSNQEVADLMSKSEASRKALLEHSAHPVRDAEALATHYRHAFEQLYGGLPRVGLYGTAWLVYAPEVSACVIDWSEMERLATEPDMPGPDAEYFRQQTRSFIQQRTEQHLQPGRLCEIEAGLSAAERIERTLDFLRRLGLA